MEITIDFNDGAYLTVRDNGVSCIYESNNVEYKGNLYNTLKYISKENKRELIKGLRSVGEGLPLPYKGVQHENKRSYKTISRCG